LSHIKKIIPRKCYFVPKPRPQDYVWTSDQEGNEKSDEEDQDSFHDAEESQKSNDEADTHTGNQDKVNKVTNDNEMIFSMTPLRTTDKYHVAFIRGTLEELIGPSIPGRLNQDGDHRVLQHALPHTTVNPIDIPENQPEQASWFYAVFRALYGDDTKFQLDEFKQCLLAFSNRHVMMREDHEVLKIWMEAFPAGVPGTWKEYWIDQAKQLQQQNCKFHEFFLDVFRRMLLHQGFQDERQPFCLGHITAEYDTTRHNQTFFTITFEPKWKPPDGVRRLVYIGQKTFSYYQILPNYEPEYVYETNIRDNKGDNACVLSKVKKTDITRNDDDDSGTEESSTSDHNKEDSDDEIEVARVIQGKVLHPLECDSDDGIMVTKTIPGKILHGQDSSSDDSIQVGPTIQGRTLREQDSNNNIEISMPPLGKSGEVTAENTPTKNIEVTTVVQQVVETSQTETADKTIENGNITNLDALLDQFEDNDDDQTTPIIHRCAIKRLRSSILDSDDEDDVADANDDDGADADEDADDVSNANEDDDVVADANEDDDVVADANEEDNAVTHADQQDNAVANTDQHESATANADKGDNAVTNTDKGDDGNDKNKQQKKTTSKKRKQATPSKRNQRQLPTSRNRQPKTATGATAAAKTPRRVPTSARRSTNRHTPGNDCHWTRRQLDMLEAIRRKNEQENKRQAQMRRQLAEKAAAKFARQQEKAKNANNIRSHHDRLRWIRFDGKDKFSLKHRHDDPYDFPYGLDDLDDYFEPWLLDTARLNQGEYIYINAEEDKSSYGQVSSLKYTPDTWTGTVILGKSKKEITLSQNWVEANFREAFRDLCTGNPGTFCKVTPGTPKHHGPTVFGNLPVIDQSGHKMNYPQGTLRTCLIGSFASCLDYIGSIEQKPGMSEKGAAIMRNLGDLLKVDDVYNKFFHIVTNQCKDEYVLIRNRKFSFQQEEKLFDMPTVVILVGNDYSMDHAITVYKNMIFDTSHTNILTRCQETLNWCCPPDGFRRILKAFSLREKYDWEKKKTNKQRRKRRKHEVH